MLRCCCSCTVVGLTILHSGGWNGQNLPLYSMHSQVSLSARCCGQRCGEIESWKNIVHFTTIPLGNEIQANLGDVGRSGRQSPPTLTHALWFFPWAGCHRTTSHSIRRLQQYLVVNEILLVGLGYTRRKHLVSFLDGSQSRRWQCTVLLHGNRVDYYRDSWWSVIGSHSYLGVVGTRALQVTAEESRSQQG